MPGSWLDLLLDIALSPGLWLSVLLAMAYAVVFTVWRGDGSRGFLRNLVFALIGFGIGQLWATQTGLAWLRVGEIQLFWGTVGAVVVMWLSRRVSRKTKVEERAR